VDLAEGADEDVEGVVDVGVEVASGNVPRVTRRATTIMTTPTSQTRTLHYPHEPSLAEV
jgi:hypothetical protein